MTAENAWYVHSGGRTFYFSLDYNGWHFLEEVSGIPWLKKIIWVIGVLRRTVVSDLRFENLCGSHLQSQVTWKPTLLWLDVKSTWLWRWLPHRFSKRRSLTTVLLRTPITQMIFFNQGMLLLVSNQFVVARDYIKQLKTLFLTPRPQSIKIKTKSDQI